MVTFSIQSSTLSNEPLWVGLLKRVQAQHGAFSPRSLHAQVGLEVLALTRNCTEPMLHAAMGRITTKSVSNQPGIWRNTVRHLLPVLKIKHTRPAQSACRAAWTCARFGISAGKGSNDQSLSSESGVGALQSARFVSMWKHWPLLFGIPESQAFPTIHAKWAAEGDRFLRAAHGWSSLSPASRKRHVSRPSAARLRRHEP